MGRNYSVVGTIAAVASTFKTTATIIAAATVRPKIYDMVMGTSGAPADNSLVWLLQRFTAAGTTTAVTPEPLDPSEPASITTAGSNATVEPTYTAGKNLLQIPLHQKASYRHSANEGKEFVLPATAANGAGLQVKSAAYTGVADTTIWFGE